MDHNEWIPKMSYIWDEWEDIENQTDSSKSIWPLHFIHPSWVERATIAAQYSTGSGSDESDMHACI